MSKVLQPTVKLENGTPEKYCFYCFPWAFSVNFAIKLNTVTYSMNQRFKNVMWVCMCVCGCRGVVNTMRERLESKPLYISNI